MEREKQDCEDINPYEYMDRYEYPGDWTAKEEPHEYMDRYEYPGEWRTSNPLGIR